MPESPANASNLAKVKRKAGQTIGRANRPGKHNETVRKLFKSGRTEREIAAITDLSKTSVHHIINRDFTKDQIESFRLSEAESLDAFRFAFLKQVDPAAIKKMIERRGMVDYAVAWDKANMIRTGNDGTSRPMVMIQVNGQVNVNNPVDNTTYQPQPVIDVV